MSAVPPRLDGDCLEITKVLNSSVVLVKDHAGRDSILLGRGIGYGRRAGERVDSEAVDRIFIPVDSLDARSLVDLLSQIPGEYVLVAKDIIAMAREVLAADFSPHLLLALTDHLHFAVERVEQGMVVVNRLSWEMRTSYPAEYDVARRALEMTRKRLRVDLPDEEAANIAFHLVNARTDPASRFDALVAARLISQLVSILSYSSGIQLADTDPDLRRFVIHLQFFAERLFTDHLIATQDGFLREQIRSRYPQADRIARLMGAHVEQTYGTTLPDDELGYLGLHLQRLLGKKSDEH